MALINESHECRGCGVPSDNFAITYSILCGERLDSTSESRRGLKSVSKLLRSAAALCGDKSLGVQTMQSQS